MKGELRSESIDDPDVPGLPDRNDYQPKDATNFYALLSLSIGPVGERGEDLLRVNLTTPKYLEESLRSGSPLLVGRHWLIVDRYDKETVFGFLAMYIEEIEADSWGELMERLSKIGYWPDYADYHDDHDYESLIQATIHGPARQRAHNRVMGSERGEAEAGTAEGQ